MASPNDIYDFDGSIDLESGRSLPIGLRVDTGIFSRNGTLWADKLYQFSGVRRARSKCGLVGWTIVADKRKRFLFESHEKGELFVVSLEIDGDVVLSGSTWSHGLRDLFRDIKLPVEASADSLETKIYDHLVVDTSGQTQPFRLEIDERTQAGSLCWAEDASLKLVGAKRMAEFTIDCWAQWNTMKVRCIIRSDAVDMLTVEYVGTPFRYRVDDGGEFRSFLQHLSLRQLAADAAAPGQIQGIDLDDSNQSGPVLVRVSGLGVDEEPRDFVRLEQRVVEGVCMPGTPLDYFINTHETRAVWATIRTSYLYQGSTRYEEQNFFQYPKGESALGCVFPGPTMQRFDREIRAAGFYDLPRDSSGAEANQAKADLPDGAV